MNPTRKAVKDLTDIRNDPLERKYDNSTYSYYVMQLTSGVV